MGMGSNPNFQGSHFRARNDDGPSEVAPPTGASWFAPKTTNWGQLVDLNFRVRMLVYSIVSINDGLHTLHLGASYNGGAYFRVTPTSSIIQFSDTTHWVNNDNTTEWPGRLGSRLLYPAPMNSLVDGDDGEDDWEIQSTSHNLNELEFEAEFSLQVVSGDVSDGDTIELRIFQLSLSPFLAGYDFTPLMTVASVPAITSTPTLVAPVGVDYAEQVTASGGVVVWSLTVAPPGATINSATGLIAWMPPEESERDRIDFTAVATTPVGSDTVSWQVCVTAPQMTATLRI